MFEQMALAGHLVVAASDGQLIGYYFCNPFTDDEALGLHQQKVSLCKQLGLVPDAARVGLGSQALVDKDFQGLGIRQQLLRLLVAQLQGQYDYLFSTINKENPRAYRAHTKDGWQVMHEDEHYWSVFLPLSSLS